LGGLKYLQILIYAFSFLVVERLREGENELLEKDVSVAFHAKLHR